MLRQACALLWGEALPPCLLQLGPCVVIGCEVTPMRGSHAALVSTLADLLPSGSSNVALITIDACVLNQRQAEGGAVGEYPRECPGSARGCAGHAFLLLVEEAGLTWSVAEAWSGEEIKDLCTHRRVWGEGGGGGKREFAATAEDLIVVHITRPQA